MSQGKSAAHTPGPWKIWHGRKLGHILACDPTHPERLFKHGIRIASVRTLDSAGEANARLIAASPTMLEALEELLTRLDEQSVYGDEIYAAIKSAKSAVRLARGESQ